MQRFIFTVILVLLVVMLLAPEIHASQKEAKSHRRRGAGKICKGSTIPNCSSKIRKSASDARIAKRQTINKDSKPLSMPNILL